MAPFCSGVSEDTSNLSVGGCGGMAVILFLCVSSWEYSLVLKVRVEGSSCQNIHSQVPIALSVFTLHNSYEV